MQCSIVRTRLLLDRKRDQEAGVLPLHERALAVPLLDRASREFEGLPLDQVLVDGTRQDLVGPGFAFGFGDGLLGLGLGLANLVFRPDGVLCCGDLQVDRLDHAFGRTRGADEAELLDLHTQHLDLVVEATANLVEECFLLGAVDLLDRVLAGDFVEDVTSDVPQVPVREPVQVVGPELHVEVGHHAVLQLIAQGDVARNDETFLRVEGDLLVVGTALVSVLRPDRCLHEGGVLEHLRCPRKVKHPSGGHRDIVDPAAVPSQRHLDADVPGADARAGRSRHEQAKHHDDQKRLLHVVLLVLHVLDDVDDVVPRDTHHDGENHQKHQDAQNELNVVGLVEQSQTEVCDRQQSQHTQHPY